MKINRRKKKKPKRLSYYGQSKKRLKKHIKRAESEATDKFLSSLGNVKVDIEIEDEISLKNFLAVLSLLFNHHGERIQVLCFGY